MALSYNQNKGFRLIFIHSIIIRILPYWFLISGCGLFNPSSEKESGTNDIPIPDPLYIRVNYPNGGEVFDPGSIVTILWESNLDTCEWGMEISLYIENDEDELIHVNTANTGIFQWYINTDLGSGDYYKIWVESLCANGEYCGGCYGDLSDSIFILTDNIIEPYVGVIHPNGGEVYTIGSQVEILWDSNLGNCTWGMNILLTKGTDPVLTINYGPPASGTFEWQIPDTLDVGDDYKIFIESLCSGGGSYCAGCHGDESDDSFSLVNY